MISIVDDDESVRASTKTLLRSAGYEVRTFVSADELLNSSALEETECLILDVRMPGTDGLELQRRLQAEGYRIPVIFITAYGDDLLRQRVKESGAVEILNKPFDAAVFLATLETALSEARPFGHLSGKRLREAAASFHERGYVEVKSVFTEDESAHFRECAECIEALANIVREIIASRDAKAAPKE